MSRWYIIHAYSGFEGKVKDAILADATRLGLESQVESIEVPVEQVTEVRRGKKVTSDHKVMPGYVLAKLEMNDQLYHLVKNTPKVTGFLGLNGKPQPISDAEAARMLHTKDEVTAATPKQKIKVDFEIGDQVKVLDGPFASFKRTGGRARFRSRPRQGFGFDLRPRDARGARIRAGRAGQVNIPLSARGEGVVSREASAVSTAKPME